MWSPVLFGWESDEERWDSELLSVSHVLYCLCWLLRLTVHFRQEYAEESWGCNLLSVYREIQWRCWLLTYLKYYKQLLREDISLWLY